MSYLSKFVIYIWNSFKDVIKKRLAGEDFKDDGSLLKFAKKLKIRGPQDYLTP